MAGTGDGRSHDPPKGSTSCETGHRYDARMTSSHAAGTPAQASTTDGVHRVSVLLYSDDITTRDAVRAAAGRRPARDVEIVSWRECATPEAVIEAMDAGGFDVVVLDGEATPAGGLGLCRQLKNEIFRCPPILVLTGRPQDGWLAGWSLADDAVLAPARPDRRGRGHRGPGPHAGRGRLTGVTTPTPAETTWPDLLAALLRREDLTTEQAGWAMAEVMNGEASPVQLAGFLVALRAKGESVEELRGIADVMLEHAHRIEVPGETIDIVGTGGDRMHSVNISTMAAMVVAATGLRVVKHGNRSASSSSGSADVLESLGVSLTLNPAQVAEVAQDGRHHVLLRQRLPPLLSPRLGHPPRPRGRHRLQRARPADQPGAADLRGRRGGRRTHRPDHRRGLREPGPRGIRLPWRRRPRRAHPGHDLHGVVGARRRRHRADPRPHRRRARAPPRRDPARRRRGAQRAGRPRPAGRCPRPGARRGGAQQRHRAGDGIRAVRAHGVAGGADHGGACGHGPRRGRHRLRRGAGPARRVGARRRRPTPTEAVVSLRDPG